MKKIFIRAVSLILAIFPAYLFTDWVVGLYTPEPLPCISSPTAGVCNLYPESNLSFPVVLIVTTVISYFLIYYLLKRLIK